MIRTVPIPKTVSRMGCTPGAGCCDECGGHNLSATPIRARQAADRARSILVSKLYGLGDLVTDPSQLMTGPNVNLNDPALLMDSSSGLTYTGSTGTIAPSGLSNNTMYLIGGALLLFLLATSKGGR